MHELMLYVVIVVNMLRHSNQLMHVYISYKPEITYIIEQGLTSH